MKRSDIVVGQEYAVLTPSASRNVDNRWGPNAKHVVALDIRPQFHSSGRSWRSNEKTVTVTVEGLGTVEAHDYTFDIGPGGQDWDGQAKRSLKVLVIDSWGWGKDARPYYTVELVPLSQVQMTWSEYTERRRAADERTKREEARAAVAEAESKRARDAAVAEAAELNEQLSSAGYDVEVQVRSVRGYGRVEPVELVLTGDIAGFVAQAVSDGKVLETAIDEGSLSEDVAVELQLRLAR